MSRSEFYISILLKYIVDKTVKKIEDSLELFILKKADFLLIILLFIFIFILDGEKAIVNSCEIEAEVECNIFANSLMGATIQDSSKRERSDISEVLKVNL